MQEFGGRKGKGNMLRLKCNLKNKPKSELLKKKASGSKDNIVFPPEVFGSVLPPEGTAGSQGGGGFPSVSPSNKTATDSFRDAPRNSSQVQPS